MGVNKNMTKFEAKNFIKNMISPKNLYEKVYIINLDDCQKEVLFSEDLKLLGKWYITNGKHWVCHSELSLEVFQDTFLNIVKLSESDAHTIEFTIDYLPFCEVLGI